VQLSVFKSDQKITDIDLNKELLENEQGPITFFLGRGKDCHVQIDDKAISRYLAKIIFEKDIWTIEKNSSEGILLVNGEILSKRKINNGDVVSVAGYTVSLKLAEKIIEKKIIPSEPIFEEPVKILDEKETEQTDFSAEPPVPAPNPENEIETITSYISNDPIDDDNLLPEHLIDEQLLEQGEESGPVPVNEEDLALPVVENSTSGEATQVFKSFVQVYLEIFGEHAPFDKYNLESNQVFIGRDAGKCQIVLKDSEVSAIHAVIKKNNITCHVEDLNSANGTLVNGVRVNKADLSNGDEILIGTTTFTIVIKSDFLEEEQETLMPVETQQEVEVEETIEELATDEQNSFTDLNTTLEMPSGKPQSLVDKWKALPNNKKIIYGVVGLGLLFLLLDDEGASKPAKEKSEIPIAKVAKIAPVANLKLSKEEEEFVESNYLLSRELVSQGKYAEALFELDKVFKVTKNQDYKSAKQTYELAKEGLRKFEDIEKKRQEEIDRKIRMEKVKELVSKAKETVKERQYDASEAIFNKIIELDPENFDVPQLKIELDAWKKEQDRIALEKATIEAERKRRVDTFQPAKNIYLQQKWYMAILKLEEFLKIKDMDEDLVKEAGTMMADAKEKLNEVELPLLGKARSLKEGQDLKGAYEQYGKVLSYNPTNIEALNEMNEIKDILHTRAKKLYREAIISESLSLFQDAKEKLQEVQQVSPIESEYYKKATDKLNDYLE
jgi:pSer/pThr/pTyr-binding forkhead associated (FHA) protein